jgi:glycosyltransferase involved in cell wall biosynthesis
MKLLIIISEDWYFCSHRKPIAVAAAQAGHVVHLGCQVADCRDEIEAAGIVLHSLPLRRGSINPLFDLGYLFGLIRLYRREKPDVVHHVAMKPCLYGSVAAWLCRVPCVVNALAGMGFLFSSQKLAVRLIKGPVLLVFRLLFNRRNSILILQNPDDIAMFRERLGVRAERIRMIQGSGVDLTVFSPRRAGVPAKTKPTFVMVSRLLRDKGVMELIQAAGILKERGIVCQILLVGDADRVNPNAVDEAFVKNAQQDGWIEWLGRRQDIADLYRAADVAILPSYREGMPKSLIEATACGLAILTTDVPGCREMVVNQTKDGSVKPGDLLVDKESRISNLHVGTNGILVAAMDAVALANAMEWLVQHTEERVRMGQASRVMAEQSLGIDKVVEQTMEIYQELVNDRL